MDLFYDLSFYVCFFVVKNFVTTIWRRNNFKSAFYLFNVAILNELRARRHFLFLLKWVFS